MEITTEWLLIKSHWEMLKSGEFCGLGFAGVKAEAGLELGKF